MNWKVLVRHSPPQKRKRKKIYTVFGNILSRLSLSMPELTSITTVWWTGLFCVFRVFSPRIPQNTASICKPFTLQLSDWFLSNALKISLPPAFQTEPLQVSAIHVRIVECGIMWKLSVSMLMQGSLETQPSSTANAELASSSKSSLSPCKANDTSN